MNSSNNWASIIALIISFGSLIFTLYWTSPIGKVEPLEPASYAIIRGMGIVQGIGPFPSDHLVFPMEWKNTSGRPVIIKNLKLTLYKLDRDSKASETGLTFTLAGEYPDVSTESFSKRYSHKNSFLVEPHSVSLNTLVFHVENYWKENSDFRFNPYDEYRLRIGYTKDSGLGVVLQSLLRATRSYADGEKDKILAKRFKIHGSVDNLSFDDLSFEDEDDPWWGYWEDTKF